MIFQEQHNRKEKSYTYFVEDFFGELTIKTDTKLSPTNLDRLSLVITKGGDKEGDTEIITGDKTKIKIHYKFIKSTKPLWEKLSQEELLKN